MHKPSPKQLADFAKSQGASDLSKSDQAGRRKDAVLLSEMVDERGVLGLASNEVEPLLEGKPAAEMAQKRKSLGTLKQSADAIAVPMASSDSALAVSRNPQVLTMTRSAP